MTTAAPGFLPLHVRFTQTAARFHDRAAVEDSQGASITYGDLDTLSNQVRDCLAALGVERGDRVGLSLYKSIDSVAALLGILKAGAAYVPVDPTAPATRNAFVFADCSVKAIFVEENLAAALRQELGDHATNTHLLCIDRGAELLPMRAFLNQGSVGGTDGRTESVASTADDLAYILYTSGSTGKPKGVMLSHRNATRFVDWCAKTFSPSPRDRFSSHAPFHFDLSILDIYTPFEGGSTLVLVSEDLGKDPARLAQFISTSELTVWYSTPSILSMLAQYGKMEEYDYSHVRLVLFAGEVFPVSHLRALKERLPHPDYFNLYGPTETNVCTYLKLPAQIEADRTDPYPIGIVCEHYQASIVDVDLKPVQPGTEGELVIHGDGVMGGYWNLADQTAAVFVHLDHRGRGYTTGDLVVQGEDGGFTFRGRKDRMIKKRGYRVELGEIEACLYQHPEVGEVAVVAVASDESGLMVHAHVVTRKGDRMSGIALKQFCSQRLPLYMVPDRFHFHAALPKTTTDKIDYQSLQTPQRQENGKERP